MNPSIDPTWYCPGCNRLSCRCNDYLDEDHADLDDEPDGIAYDPTGIGYDPKGIGYDPKGIGYDPVEPFNGPNLWPDEDDGLPF